LRRLSVADRIAYVSDAPFPPYVQLCNFLPVDDHRGLVDWVLTAARRFKPAAVRSRQAGAKNRVDTSFRVALINTDLGPLRPAIEGRLQNSLSDIMRGTGYRGEEPRSLELELAAHGDGAHFNAHSDLPIGEGRGPLGAAPGEDRVISAVLYFYDEPKGFSGGCLRLFRFGAASEADRAQPENFVDIEPLQNSLVAFPSWATHEVRHVSCPSKRFEHYRFALNCWYCRRL